MLNKLFILVGPSGVGKDAVMAGVMRKLPELRILVSYTTRLPRPREKEGFDYFFVSLEKFQELISNKQLLEYEEVHPGLYYGTPLEQINNLLEKYNVIKVIDILGAQSLKKYFPRQTTIIFIKPPSLEELELRIKKRGGISEKEVEERLSRLSFEMAHANIADFQITNKILSECVSEVTQIIQSELKK